MENPITELLADLKEAEVLEQVRRQLDAGADPLKVLAACQAGMVEVGRKFENSTYYISDLMMAGEIFKQIGELLAPKLKGAGGPTGGKIVAGTVKGDIHDIGKDIVVGMLKSANFDVTDLGVDVPPERFVEAVKQSGAEVVSLSALLTIAFDSLKATVEAFEQADLRDRVKIMIGGGPVDEKVCRFAGADAWGSDAQAAVKLAKGWTS